MGVKVSDWQNGSSSEAPDAAVSVQEFQDSRISEQQQCLRRKGVEKSVLDDIMGDPDDFRDLGDSDGESDEGRWEDTVREALEEATVADGAAQLENVESEDITGKVPESSSARKDDFKSISSVLNKMLEAGPSRESGIEDQDSGRQQHADQNNMPMPILGAGNESSKPGKLHQTRYFIIKSFNHNNIAKSIEKGIWATQAMNEQVLNDAFESTERLLLIFSVNMSGHFQGYARMTSPIGRRKANVWNESNDKANPWGGTFSVEWLRLHDLPFQKTVHLKNPLNSFKPVKISRDCQELTLEIGEALCALIDEGADREGKPKRKVGPGDAVITKRPRGERSPLPLNSLHKHQIPAATMTGHTAPTMYAAMQFSPTMLHESYNPQMSITSFPGRLSSTASSFREHPRGARCSRSPQPSEKSLDLNQEGRDRFSGREEQSRVCRSNQKADTPPEDDFLNMTYEEYLQHHGKAREHEGHHQGVGSVSSYRPSPLRGAGWMAGGGGPGMGYSDDQYSNYLANWYRSQQVQVASGDGYYAAQAMSSSYTGIHHP